MPCQADGATHKAGAVIFLAAEDDVADTLVPKFRVAGADLDMVIVVPDVKWSFPSCIDAVGERRPRSTRSDRRDRPD